MTSSSIQKMLLAAAALGAASVEAVSLSARAFLESKLAAQAGDAQCTTYDMSQCKKVERFLPSGYTLGDNVSNSDFTEGACYIWLVAYMNDYKKHYFFQARATGDTDLKCFYINNDVLTANINNPLLTQSNSEASMSDQEFETGDAGASTTELAEAGSMKPGSLIMMKDGQFPCKVTAFSTAKPGKHGSAKAMITAKDIFTEKQYDETFGTGDMIPRPIVKKVELPCLGLEDDRTLQLMLESGDLKEDLDLPTESHLIDVANRIKANLATAESNGQQVMVTVQKWGDKQQVIDTRIVDVDDPANIAWYL